MEKEASWMETSVIVDGEMAEAVSEVLARYAPTGVVLESTLIKDNPEGGGHPIGPLRVSAYIPYNDQVEEVRQKIEEAFWHLSQVRHVPRPSFKLIQEANWAEAWKEHYKPVLIGNRLVIVPAWLENPEPERLAIKMDPGMAFGTGTHPTTQLVLEILDGFIKEGNDFMDVLDIGSGSGILSIAAKKLGAGRAFGVDVDAKAVEIARENAAENGVADSLEFAPGSVLEVIAGAFEIRQAPVVIANIIQPILLKLIRDGLLELVLTGGVLILSGILEEQLEEIVYALSARGFYIREKTQIEDWVAVIAQA